MFWQDVQHNYQQDTDRVVRVYLDKFGYFYPSPEVTIDKKEFLFPSYLKFKATAETEASANLYAYFPDAFSVYQLGKVLRGDKVQVLDQFQNPCGLFRLFRVQRVKELLDGAFSGSSLIKEYLAHV